MYEEVTFHFFSRSETDSDRKGGFEIFKIPLCKCNN